MKSTKVKVACTWCGQYTPRGPACETCGSPLTTGFAPLRLPATITEHHCRYCRRLTFDSMCDACRAVLETFRNLSESALVAG